MILPLYLWNISFFSDRRTWQKLSNRNKTLERNVTLSTGFLNKLKKVIFARIWSTKVTNPRPTPVFHSLALILDWVQSQELALTWTNMWLIFGRQLNSWTFLLSAVFARSDCLEVMMTTDNVLGIWRFARDLFLLALEKTAWNCKRSRFLEICEGEVFCLQGCLGCCSPLTISAVGRRRRCWIASWTWWRGTRGTWWRWPRQWRLQVWIAWEFLELFKDTFIHNFTGHKTFVKGSTCCNLYTFIWNKW